MQFCFDFILACFLLVFLLKHKLYESTYYTSPKTTSHQHKSSNLRSLCLTIFLCLPPQCLINDYKLQCLHIFLRKLFI